jgi:predicted metalloendopeptidase
VEDLKTIDWLDEKTRKFALDKAKNMRSHIGFPDELMDDRKIEEYYRDLTFNKNSTLLGEIFKLDDFYRRKDYLKLRLPVNKTEWTKYAHVADVNARYSWLDNEISSSANI